MGDVWESSALIEEVWESGSTPGVEWTVVIREGDIVTGGSGVDLSDTTPQDLGTAAAGVSSEASRADHVHDMPTAADIAVDASGFNGNLTTSDDTVQEIAQKLDDLVIPAAGIADPGGANDDILQRKSGAWTNRTVAQVKTDLGIPGVEIVYSQDEGSAVNLATSGTSLLDTAPTLTMAAGDVVEIEVWFNQVNNSGALRQQTIALKLGSTTLMTLLNVYGTSATTYAACVRASIRAQGTTDVNASGVLLSAIGTLVVLGHGVATENVGTGVTVDVLGAAPTATATQTMTVQHIKIVKVKA